MEPAQNRLTRRFGDILRSGGKLLIPYVTACYPSQEATAAILGRLDQAGVAAVELGFPFSDPVADGPVIQTSFVRALDKGFRVAQAFEVVASVRAQLSVPIIAMVSYSMVYRCGLEKFVGSAADAGYDAILSPDLSVEESGPLVEMAGRHGLVVPMLIAPTSPPARRDAIGGACSGFIYCVSVAGTTGERDGLPAGLVDQVAGLRSFAKPVCVGFGISRPEHVAAVWRIADGAIVGSAFVRRLNEAVDANLDAQQVAEQIGRQVDELLHTDGAAAE
jgi:tryptophan synthase alpha chain